MRIATIVLIVLTLIGVSAAETGIVLNERCFAKPADHVSGHDMGFCYGYIAGVENTTDVFQGMVDAQGKPLVKSDVCVPNDATNGQLFLVVKKYFADNPEKLNWPASGLIYNAFIKAFPCK